MRVYLTVMLLSNTVKGIFLTSTMLSRIRCLRRLLPNLGLTPLSTRCRLPLRGLRRILSRERSGSHTRWSAKAQRQLTTRSRALTAILKRQRMSYSILTISSGCEHWGKKYGLRLQMIKLSSKHRKSSLMRH